MNEDERKEIHEKNLQKHNEFLKLHGIEPKKQVPMEYGNIWDLFAQKPEVSPETVADYEDRKRISSVCTDILRLFKEKDLLDDEIISHSSEWESETYAIQDLLNEITDEYTKKTKRCLGMRRVGMVIGYRSPYCNAGRQRTNRETCWYCGGKLETVKEEKP